MRTLLVLALLIAAIVILLATLAGYVVGAVLLFRYLSKRK
jgi:hypothetical protein